MAPRGSVYYRTLHDITNTKLDELAKKKTTFEALYRHVSAVIDSEEHPSKKLSTLAEVVKAYFGVSSAYSYIVRGSSANPRLEIDLNNLDRFLA